MTHKTTDTYLEIEYKYLAGAVTPNMLQDAILKTDLAIAETALYPMTEDYFYTKDSSPLDPALNFVRVRGDRFRTGIELTIKGMIDDSLAVRNEVNVTVEGSKDDREYSQKLNDINAFLKMLGYSPFKTLYKSVTVFTLEDSTVVGHYTAYDNTNKLISLIEIEVNPSKSLAYLNKIEDKLGQYLTAIGKEHRLNDSLLSIFTTSVDKYKDQLISGSGIKR